MFWMFTQTRHNCKLTWVKYQISQQSSGPDNFPQSCVECSGPCLCFYLQPLERKQQRAFSFFFRFFRWQGETVNWKSTYCANLHFQLWSPITPVTGGKSQIVKPDMFENTRTMEMGSHLLFCSHPSQRQHPVIFTRYSDHQIDASIQSLLSLKNQKSDPPMTPHMEAEPNLAWNEYFLYQI